MASYQKTVIVGNLGRDVETRQVGDVTVASFSVAVSEKYKTKSGEQKEDTTWFNVTLWRGLADVAAKYLKKGDAVLIEGKIKTRDYEDKDGNKRQAWDLVGDNMVMLGSKSDGGQKNGGQQNAFQDDEPDDLPF